MALDRPRLAVRKVPQSELVASMFVESTVLFRDEERPELAPKTLRYMRGATPLDAFREEVRAAVVAAAIQVLNDAAKNIAKTRVTPSRLTLLSRDLPHLSNATGQLVNPEQEGIRYALELLEHLGVAVGAIDVENEKPVLYVPEPYREVDHELDPHA